jgi:hypothetical protein
MSLSLYSGNRFKKGAHSMSVAASVVTYTVLPERADELAANVRDHLVPAAQQIAGYRGFLLLDQGEHKRMAILLFDSIEGVREAQQRLSPLGEQYTYALMSGPAIGSLGRAVVADGVFA